MKLYTVFSPQCIKLFILNAILLEKWDFTYMERPKTGLFILILGLVQWCLIFNPLNQIGSEF